MLFAVIFAVAAAMLPVPGPAEELYFPEGITLIGEEAFAGCSGVYSVTLPEGLEEIQARAFADTEMYYITIPESVRTIAENAFEGVTTPMLIRTIPGTEGMRYAMTNGVDFEAETVCRALLIGQGGYPSPYTLSGPAKDVVTMKKAISDRFEVTIRQDLTKGQILEEIAAVLGRAREEDISLLYYSGHGYMSDDPGMNGALVGIDHSTYLTAAELRNALDRIPGRKIVIIDACYSGAMIGRSTARGSGTAGGKEAPAKTFVHAFLSRKMRGENLAASPYYVMVSSTGTEKSWENKDGGIFTEAFAASREQGDGNRDGIVTMLECYSYTRNRVREKAEENGLGQSVQVYPEECRQFGIFR